MTTATLLVELLTEELPPKALSRLGEVFSAQIHAGLAARKLLTASDQYQWFATPRRLAIQVPGVLAVAPDAAVTEKIMPVSVALDHVFPSDWRVRTYGSPAAPCASVYTPSIDGADKVAPTVAVPVLPVFA